MKMKTKKAIILPETLKIIIAVLCIVLLVYLAWSLYSIFVVKSKTAQARETLKQIIAKIDGLEEGEAEGHLITAPKDWYIISYKKGESSPKQCLGGNCLCICQMPEIEVCDKEGICKKVENEIKVLGLRKTLQYSVGNYLKIDKAAINIGFKKEGGLITISEIMEGSGGELFNEFLDYKSDFLDKGEIEIREQIKIFFNSNLIPAKREYSEEKKALVKNIQYYFKDYNYPIYFYLLQGEGYAELNIELANILKVAAGKDREVGKEEKIPDWPILVIENPEGKYVKSFIVIFELRR